VSDPAADQEREWAFFSESIDPLVRELLALDDAWDAYDRATMVPGLLIDTAPGGALELPHAGGVYVAWSELADMFETGKTPIPDAHATLRLAAARWLDRPAEPNASFIEQWISDASDAVQARFSRDGDWWRDPLKDRPAVPLSGPREPHEDPSVG
jgi:hypothetical protein